MTKTPHVLVVIALALLLPLTTEANTAGPTTSTPKIYPNSAEKQAYNNRARELDAKKDYAGALAALRASCAYEPDSDFSELCMMEAREYAQKHNLSN